MTALQHILAVIEKAWDDNRNAMRADMSLSCCGRPPQPNIVNDRVMLRLLLEQVARELGGEPHAD